jgi:predicted Zn-dependent protease
MAPETSLPGGAVQAFAAVLCADTGPELSAEQACVLRLLYRQWPDAPELALALAQRYIHCGDLGAAAEVLGNAYARVPRHAAVTALLAWTLHALEDQTWRVHAHEVELLEPDDLAQAIVAAIA